MNMRNGSRSPGSGQAVEDYSVFCEGDIEPSLNKKIDTLIESDKGYIVYLDDDLEVEWAINDSYGEVPEGFSDVANRIGHLDALSVAVLGARQMESFRRLLAESMARILGDKDAKKARENLDTAEAFLSARGLERARTWYLSTSFISTAIALLAACLTWHWRASVVESIGQHGLEVTVGALFGAFGSLISIFERASRIDMSAVAGPGIHCFESAARVITGIFGSLLVGLAVKANLVLGVAESSDHPFAYLLALCVAGGASERLVPSLIKRVENSLAGGNGSK